MGGATPTEVASYRKRWRHVFMYSGTPRFFVLPPQTKTYIHICIVVKETKRPGFGGRPHSTYVTTHPRSCGGGDEKQRKSRSTGVQKIGGVI